MRRAGTIALAVALLLGCWRAPHATDGANGPAPVKPRGAVVLEPPRIEIGDTARLEVAVVTPPGWRAAPLPPVQPPEGLSLLYVGALHVDREPGRWIHRTTLRVRALRTGSVSWPAMQVTVTRPDAKEERVDIPARPIHVTALLPSSGPPGRFHSYRLPPPLRPRWATLLLVAVGILAAAAGLAAARRLRAGRPAPADRLANGAGAPPADPTAQIQEAIEAAEAMAQREPGRAADLLSSAIRRSVAGRFGAPTLVATTEELAATRPPFALTTRWKPLVALLGRLDQLRFAAPDARGDARAVPEMIDEARALARALRPPTQPPRSVRGGRP